MAKAKKVAKKRKASGAHRLDRPPVRIYVTLDELGVSKAGKSLRDARDEAQGDSYMFGETRIYEYRLVDASARAVVGKGTERG